MSRIWGKGNSVYLVPLYALLLNLLKFAFEFSLSLQSLLSSTHIQHPAIQVLAIHFSYCLTEQNTSYSTAPGYSHTYKHNVILLYPSGIFMVFEVDEAKATRASPFISHHTNAEGLTCQSEAE